MSGWSNITKIVKNIKESEKAPFVLCDGVVYIMFIDKGSYLVIKEFDDLGVEVCYTDKSFGDAKTKDKEYIKKYFDIENKTIISGFQTHTKNIKAVKSFKDVYFKETDGFITNIKEAAIWTKYADCLPIFLFDKGKKVIGAVHSGWKGSFSQIGIEAISKMIKEYGSSKQDIIIGFGIGICGTHYQVGEDFYKDFNNKFSHEIIEPSFIKKDGRYYFDNQKFNFLNFVHNGIPKENIITNDICTYEDKRFFSYRREKNDPGRNGAIIFFK